MELGHKRVTVNVTGYRFDSYSRKMKYLIFYFLRSGEEAKRGVEFRHSTTHYVS